MVYQKPSETTEFRSSRGGVRPWRIPAMQATINQREVGADTDTFAMALRAALRQAPKVILVGEMRDTETINTALEASETGHLVLSTLHTIDASKTIDRIVGVFPKNEERRFRAAAGVHCSTVPAVRMPAS